jgi:hypothetical protein
LPMQEFKALRNIVDNTLWGEVGVGVNMRNIMGVSCRVEFFIWLWKGHAWI